MKSFIKNIFHFVRELLLQGWMKPGRDDLAPNVALVSKRFNEVKDNKKHNRVEFSLIFF